MEKIYNLCTYNIISHCVAIFLLTGLYCTEKGSVLLTLTSNMTQFNLRYR